MIEWAENIGWGSGSTFQTAASGGLMKHGLADEESMLLRGIIAAASQALRKTHSFDLSEYIGDQGPRGPAGPRGLPGLPGIGTDYVPTTHISSGGHPPSNRRGPTHIHDVPDDDYYRILTIWSHVATAGFRYGLEEIDVRGWAVFENNTGADRTLTIWLMWWDPADGELTGPGPDNATLIGGYESGVIPAGGSGTVRTRGTFDPSETGFSSSIILLAQIDTYSHDDVVAKGNHYGITGRGTWPKLGV